MAMGIAGAVIGIVVGLFIASILLPSALTEIYAANTSGWNTAVITVFQVLMPVLAVISASLLFFKIKGKI